ncbi:acyl-synthetase [Stylonychia lemnae]|uniref:Acyl-synthetase n=1 Tax=Stylonychia lemnae TaxID=5949 RepID=A0A078AD44_STYLE|nr:acyl-synthetase [Stylonychia lemnae]|eukprot:CDW79766.1 acyl-synthetase [Stylonychia lemnae]
MDLEVTQKKVLYSEEYKNFRDDKFTYFDEVGKSFPWIKQYTQLYEFDDPFYKWYPDGLINACYTSLDIHIKEGRGDQVAIIAFNQNTQAMIKHSYQETYDKTAKLASSLKSQFGLKVGDRVIIYSNNMFESLTMTLACARIGVIFQVVQHVDSARELALKINELEPKVIFTVNIQVSPVGAVLKSKEMIDEVTQFIEKDSLRQDLRYICANNGNDYEDTPDTWVRYEDLVGENISACECEPLSPNTPLIILNTSGSTGRPKFIVRSHLAAISPAISLRNNYNLHNQDVIGAFTTFGYSLYYQFQSFGALTNGNQILLYSGNVTLLPVMDLIQNLKIKIMLAFSMPFQKMRDKNTIHEIDNKENLRCLESIIVTGEKSPPEFLDDLRRIFPYSRLSDQYGTCEATVLTSNLLNLEKYCLNEGQSYTNQGWPLLGVDLRLLDNEGKEITEQNVEGNVVIKMPGPLTLLSEIYQDREGTIQKYYKEFPGYMRTGDLGQWDINECFQFLRRKEDIIYVNHIQCSAKYLQDILLQVEGVKEAMIASDSLRDFAYAFITTDEGNRSEEYRAKLMKYLFEKSNGIGKLGGVIFINKLPQTSNGKVSMELMRCLLNKLSLSHMTIGNQLEIETIQRQVEDQVGDVNNRY